MASYFLQRFEDDLFNYQLLIQFNRQQAATLSAIMTRIVTYTYTYAFERTSAA